VEKAFEDELRKIREEIAREKDITETAALMRIGQLSALGMAIDVLIDMTPSPAETRVKIGESIRPVWRLFAESENTGHQVMAIAMQEELERITGAA
jgi:hypothetical protein